MRIRDMARILAGAGFVLAAATSSTMAVDMTIVRVTSPARLLEKPCEDNSIKPIAVVPAGSAIEVVNDDLEKWVYAKVRLGTLLREGFLLKSQTTWQPEGVDNGR